MADFGRAQDFGTIGAEGGGCGGTSQKSGDINRHYSKLKILDYYLAFIHYFGFSINPLDDLGSRYLSIRVKQVASAAAASSLKQQQRVQHDDQHHHDQHHHHRDWQTSPSPSDQIDAPLPSVHSDPVLDLRDETDDVEMGAGRGITGDLGAKNRGRKIRFNNIMRSLGELFRRESCLPIKSNLAPHWQQHQQQQGRHCRLLKSLVKLIAIGLTSFLAFNHVIVLVLYIYEGTKGFMELMLELRLVITKFSALIFVISWHRNQTKVRQLVKLVKSTCVYILTSGQQESEITEPACIGGFGGCPSGSGLELNSNGEQADCSAPEAADQSELQAQLQAQLQRRGSCKLDKLNWKILNWWLMCTCVTIIHFSLSEAEIRTAQHLWQWLDDYSLHQLSNETTSMSTLFMMASFDNYIYTVHVYGTRLIGASIICIVCSFQVENIHYLNEQTLAALRSVASLPPNSRLTSTDKCRQKASEQAELLFVLAESDWLQVERARKVAKPMGWLSSTLDHELSRLQLQRSVRRLNNNLVAYCTALVNQLLNCLHGCSSNLKIWPLSSTGTGHTTATINTGAGTSRENNAESMHNDCVIRGGNRVTPIARSPPIDWRSRAGDNYNDAGGDEVNELTLGVWAEDVKVPTSSLSRTESDDDGSWAMGALDACEPVEHETGFEHSARLLPGDLKNQRIAQRVSVASGGVVPGESRGARVSENNNVAATSRRYKSGPTPMLASDSAGGDLSNQVMTDSCSKDSSGKGSACSDNSDALLMPDAFCSNGSKKRTATPMATIVPCRKRPYLTIAAAAMAPPVGRFAASNYLAQEHNYLAGKPILSSTDPKLTMDQPARYASAVWSLGVANLTSNCLSSADIGFVSQHDFYLPGKKFAQSSPPLPSSAFRASIKNNNSAINNVAHSRHSDCNRVPADQQPNHQLGRWLELHLDKLACKYELVRTVNTRVDNCFGKMLLSQYSFLFLMSCIDVVYFSLSFNPKTKTKYIIVSGMILLWWPYLLLYKFASDIGLASRQLLTSVRRLARLAIVLQLSASAPATESVSGCVRQVSNRVPFSNQSTLLNQYVNSKSNVIGEQWKVPTIAQQQQERRRFRFGSIAAKLSPDMANSAMCNYFNAQQRVTTRRARILDKLEHVFKPSHLSIVGVMTMDKFFLINFAKIVITASVMTIQFISKG